MMKFQASWLWGARCWGKVGRWKVGREGAVLEAKIRLELRRRGAASKPDRNQPSALIGLACGPRNRFWGRNSVVSARPTYNQVVTSFFGCHLRVRAGLLTEASSQLFRFYRPRKAPKATKLELILHSGIPGLLFQRRTCARGIHQLIIHLSASASPLTTTRHRHHGQRW